MLSSDIRRMVAITSPLRMIKGSVPASFDIATGTWTTPAAVTCGRMIIGAITDICSCTSCCAPFLSCVCAARALRYASQLARCFLAVRFASGGASSSLSVSMSLSLSDSLSSSGVSSSLASAQSWSSCASSAMSVCGAWMTPSVSKIIVQWTCSGVVSTLAITACMHLSPGATYMSSVALHVAVISEYCITDFTVFTSASWTCACRSCSVCWISFCCVSFTLTVVCFGCGWTSLLSVSCCVHRWACCNAAI